MLAAGHKQALGVLIAATGSILIGGGAFYGAFSPMVQIEGVALLMIVIMGAVEGNWYGR